MNLAIVRNLPQSLDLVWREVESLIEELPDGGNLSTPKLAKYLNGLEHPDIKDPVTKDKIEYLRKEDILQPTAAGGKKRKSWRYGIEQARLALFVELLKQREGMGVQEIKVRLSARAGHAGGYPDDLGQEMQEMVPGKGPRTPALGGLAYTFLQNRVLSSLLVALAKDEMLIVPQRCIVFVRALPGEPEVVATGRLDWTELKSRLEPTVGNAWYVGAAYELQDKLYMYPSLENLLKKKERLVREIHDYRFFSTSLVGSRNNRSFEFIIGFPRQDLHLPTVNSIVKTLSAAESFALSNITGMDLLFDVAFPEEQIKDEGSTLRTAVNIVTAISEELDYCGLLLPAKGVDNELQVQEWSRDFPTGLEERRVKLPEFLSGWCYSFGRSVYINKTVDNDPRISHWDIEKPAAAAAVPAIAIDRQGKSNIVGVLYVAKRSWSNINEPVGVQIFTDAVRAALEQLGYVCGEILARDDLERGSVFAISQRGDAQFHNPSFRDLDALVSAISSMLKEPIDPELTDQSWVYLATLRCEILKPGIVTNVEAVRRWLLKLVEGVVKTYLSRQFGQWNFRTAAPVASCEVKEGDFVFALMQISTIPESQFKNEIMRDLRKKLADTKVPGMRVSFYPWGVPFRYGSLHREFSESAKATTANLKKRLLDALDGSKYIALGHDALHSGDLDQASTYFQVAIRNRPDSSYLYKHLAEVEMLNEKYPEAIALCEKALKRQPPPAPIDESYRYPSAQCLLADCLFLEKRFEEAMCEYEDALASSEAEGRPAEQRADFMVRYGIALTGIPMNRYLDIRDKLEEKRKESHRRRKLSESPHQEAMALFEEARDLAIRPDSTDSDIRRQDAEYHLRLGLTHLIARDIDRARTDFAKARRYDPDALDIAQTHFFAIAIMHAATRINSQEMS